MAHLDVFIDSKYDNYKLSLSIFNAINPKGVIQLIHGMEEYKERYNSFAQTLSNNGYTVVLSDLRAHGKNTPIKDLGYFKKENGHIALIKDQETILDFIKKEFEDLPIYLFAHSMGTIITRNLLQTKDTQYSKVILSGSPNYTPAAKIGLQLAKFICLFKENKKARLLYNMSLGSFNNKITKPKTKLDWLSYNEENVSNYINDEYCGFGFTNSAYKDLFKLVINMQKLGNKRNPKLPIFLISGIDDPVTGFHKGCIHTIKTLNSFGYLLIQSKEYGLMRHETLNEINNELVINDIITFLEK